MADERDPILVKLLEERIRVVFGPADVIVGRRDFSERYEVRGERGPNDVRPLLARISDMLLKDEDFDVIDRILREALEELEG